MKWFQTKAFFAAVKDFHDRISYSTFFDGSEEVEYRIMERAV